MILCKSAVDRGFAHGTLYKTDTVDLRTEKGDKDQVFAPDTRKPRCVLLVLVHASGRLRGLWIGCSGIREGCLLPAAQ